MSARQFIRNVLPPIIPAVVVTMTTELAVRQGWVPSFLVPALAERPLSFQAWPRDFVSRERLRFELDRSVQTTELGRGRNGGGVRRY